MMPLSMADQEKECIIRKIGGNPEVKKHLENLGFVVGGSVQLGGWGSDSFGGFIDDFRVWKGALAEL